MVLSIAFFLQLIKLLSHDNLHMFVMTLWCIWKCKNKKLWDDVESDPRYLFDWLMNPCINDNRCIQSIKIWQFQVRVSKLAHRITVTTMRSGGENQLWMRLSATLMLQFLRIKGVMV